MATVLIIVAMLVIAISIAVIAFAKKYVIEYKEVQLGALGVIVVALIVMSMTSFTTMTMLFSALIGAVPTVVLVVGLVQLWEYVYYQIEFKEDIHEEIALKALAIGGAIVLAIFWLCVSFAVFNFIMY